MGMISRLERIWERDKNYASRYATVFSGSVMIHAVLAILFYFSGRMSYVWMNAASVGVYFVWLYLLSNRPITDAMLLVPYADVVIHACVYNLALGSGPAFYLYAIVIIPVSFFLSIRDARVKNPALVTAMLSTVSIMLMLATLTREPRHPFADDAVTSQFFMVNMLLCAILLSLYTWEFMTETRSTQDNLSYHAEYDQLTGLRNRYSLLKQVQKIHGTQYCAIMCDIDDFKKINDSYGHNVGDQVLQRIGKCLKGCIRQEDIICRWGGEEFLMVVRADMETAMAAAVRVRRKLTTVTVDADEENIRVTMTFGIADCLEAESFEKVVAAADANLLRGKRSGKNCIVTSTDELQTQELSAPPAELDTASLSGALFSALAATSDTTYIYICDLSTNVSRWSKTAVDYFGLPGEYMYDAGNVWLGFVHPEDRAAYAADIDAVFSGRKRTHEVTYRARNKNGDYVVCVCRGVITEGDTTHPPMFAGTMTNLGLADSNMGMGC